MKILQNRTFAVAVFAVTVILFTLVGSHRSLTKACQRVEDAFFESHTLQEGHYTCPAEQLEHCARYANSILAAISGRLPEQIYSDVYTSRRALIDALVERDISDIYIAQSALTRAIDAANSQAISQGVQAELDDFTRLVADYRSAANKAASSGYNAYVYEFLENTVSRFPTNILRHLTLVEMPERYE